MCRSSARATLFPYTTLFRSNFAAGTMGIPYFGLFSACATSMESLALSAFMINSHGANYILSGSSSHNRSEEHTSELQSRGHLVCRLLLERKKQRRIII